MSKPIKYILILLVLAIITIGIIFLPKIFSKQGENKPTTSPQNQMLSADGYVIKSQILENEIKTTGTIRANEEVEIRSEVSRKITGIYFKEGTVVRQGQTLFRLDASDLFAKLRKQEILETLAVVKLDREHKLYEKGLTSQQEFEILQSELDQIRQDIQITNIDLSKTSIRAPFTGRIGLRNVSKGAYATPSVVLVTMQDIGRVKIDFSIPEKYSNVFTKGQNIHFTVDGVEDIFEAEIYAYEPKVEDNTRTLLLRAICGSPKNKLLPGTFANVTLKLNVNKDAILVPTQALVPKLKGQSIFVLRNGKANSIDIDIGDRTDEFIQIISPDIHTGDTVIITNILRVKNDTPVKISKTQ